MWSVRVPSGSQHSSSLLTFPLAHTEPNATSLAGASVALVHSVFGSTAHVAEGSTPEEGWLNSFALLGVPLVDIY